MQAPYFVPLILPAYLAWLVLALPAIPLVGWDIVRALTTERALRKVLGPAVGLALWLAIVQLTGRASCSFSLGLLVGTLSMPAFAVAFRLARRSEPRRATRLFGDGASVHTLAFALALTVPVALLAFRYAFHDEELGTGHLATASQILNDVFPPRHLTFPTKEFRYHYGFDVLVASICAVFRVAPDTAIDTATSCLWLYSALLLHAIGEVWFGRGRGAFAMVTLLFIGGVPVCFDGSPFDKLELLQLCSVGPLHVLPPFVSFFFQHPWGLGLPLALAAILVATAREHQRPWARLGVLVVLLSALSIAQAVLFVALVASIAAAELWYVRRLEVHRGWSALWIVAGCGAALTIARGMGGFFLPAPGLGPGASFHLEWGMLGPPSEALLWIGQSFGLAAPLGLVGALVLPPRARPLVVLLMLGGMAVLLTVSNPGIQYDIIMKFSLLSLLAAAFAATGAITRLVGGRGFGPLWRRPARLALAVVLSLATAASGFAFAIYLIFFPDDAPGYVSMRPREMSRDDFEAASFLRREVKPGEIVYRREGPAMRYAQWAGLSTPWPYSYVSGYGISLAMLSARQELLKALPALPELYAKQGIVWFVLEATDMKMGRIVGGWVAAGKSHEVKRVGSLRIYKLDVRAPR